MEKIKFNQVLFVLFVVASLLAIYGFLRKGTASPPVMVRYDDGSYVSDSAILHDTRFWNNYPGLVIKTEREPLTTQNLLDVGVGRSLLENLQKKVFLRLNLGAYSKDSLLAVQLFSAIAGGRQDLVVLMDQSTRHFLQKRNLYKGDSSSGGVILKDLPLTIERFKFSYFFQLSADDQAEDVYIPRVEVPQVTEKYLLAHE